MLPEEKERVLAFFETEARWCQHAEARDTNGGAVQYDDPEAVAWDLTGGLFRLFGPQRTNVLLGQIERHISGRKRPYQFGRDPVIESILALQSYNDRPETTFETLVGCLQTIPVWAGVARSTT